MQLQASASLPEAKHPPEHAAQQHDLHTEHYRLQLQHEQQQHDPEPPHVIPWDPDPIPRQLRLPEPPSKCTIPAWVKDCYEKDEMAAKGAEFGSIFLRTGMVPEVGMALYLQLTYDHDGSHGDHYRGWARMMGQITCVCDPPEVGVYAKYEGQQQRLSEEQLQQQRRVLPALPASIFGEDAICTCCRTQQQVVEQYGAVHGQRIKAQMWLSKMDLAMQPQLGGRWDIELVCNDNLENMWVLCSMAPAAADDQPASSAGVAPSRQAHQPAVQQPGRQHSAQPQPPHARQEQPGPQQDSWEARQQQQQRDKYQERQQQDRPDDRRGWAGREQQGQRGSWDRDRDQQQRGGGGFKRERDSRGDSEQDRRSHHYSDRGREYDREYSSGRERDSREWKRREAGSAAGRGGR